ncbi:recombinase family protein [Streptomyces sp. NBC_01267]|uniref:recombinase family protein n=1 Tax=Streptomyces sp. NBC_01267 TaxID=2903805 RepID=UPI002E309C4A|nr:recombinase family protein [Streptomyces sp. NBC_01267]
MSNGEELPPEQLMDIYARKSVKIEGRRGDLSPAMQEGRGRDWGEWQGLTVRRVWADKLSASKNIKRPDYDRALLALANGEIKTLWCYKLDRFSRKGALAVLSVLEGLNGGRIIFGEDGLDSSDPNHRRMIMWKAEDAREESERISKRVTDTKTSQRDRGEWVSGRVPYGLVADEDRKLIPDTSRAHPEHPNKGSKATIAKRIFERAAGGKTLREIAAELDNEGIPGPMGGFWNPNTIYRLLHNPALSGWQVVKLGNGPGTIYTDPKGKRVRAGVCLVSDADRERATRTIAGHQKPDKTTSGTARGRRHHLLTDLTECATCGRSAPMSSRSYACMSTQGHRCAAPASAYAPPLERFVRDQWLNQLTNSDPEDPLLVVVAQRWGVLTQPEETAEIEEARASLAAAESQMERLLRDRRKGLYEGPAARFFEPAWDDVNRDMQEARTLLKGVGGVAVDISFLLDHHTAMEAWEAADIPLRRELLRLAIDRIKINKVTTVSKRGEFNGFDRVDIRWATVSEV